MEDTESRDLEKNQRRTEKVNKGKKKRRKTRKTRIDKRHGTKNKEEKPIKILYNNINGQANKMWEEIKEMKNREKYNLICLTETKWQEGAKHKTLEGYKEEIAKRPPETKKGGGIVVYMRKEDKSYKWEDKNGNTDEMRTEILWTIIKTKIEDIAVGTLYMASGEGQKARDWNDKIEELVNNDVHEMYEEGKRIILIGDFNGHIAEEDGGVHGCTHQTNINGERIKRIMKHNNLHMINKIEQCRGKWTWMARDRKSIVDYVLADQTITNKIKSMTIDDEGKKLAQQSDHNWIELEIKAEVEQTSNLRKEQMGTRWKINPNTNWDKYREEINHMLNKWMEENNKGGEK